ncbi:MAG: hypothetical protein V1752_00955 [Candidatus Firestonebacteria bacterium]
MLEFRTTERFEKNLKILPKEIKKKFYKQLNLLLSNVRHPSLHTKRIQGANEIWEGRVDYKYRFTFNIYQGIIILRVIGNHDEVLKRP